MRNIHKIMTSFLLLTFGLLSSSFNSIQANGIESSLAGVSERNLSQMPQKYLFRTRAIPVDQKRILLRSFNNDKIGMRPYILGLFGLSFVDVPSSIFTSSLTLSSWGTILGMIYQYFNDKNFFDDNKKKLWWGFVGLPISIIANGFYLQGAIKKINEELFEKLLVDRGY